MSDVKPPTVAQLKRKVERLEAKVAELQRQNTRHIQIYGDQAMEIIDLRMRAEQAIAILSGKEE